jgi:hypothetical protein
MVTSVFFKSKIDELLLKKKRLTIVGSIGKNSKVLDMIMLMYKSFYRQLLTKQDIWVS